MSCDRAAPAVTVLLMLSLCSMVVSLDNVVLLRLGVTPMKIGGCVFDVLCVDSMFVTSVVSVCVFRRLCSPLAPGESMPTARKLVIGVVRLVMWVKLVVWLVSLPPVLTPSFMGIALCWCVVRCVVTWLTLLPPKLKWPTTVWLLVSWNSCGSGPLGRGRGAVVLILIKLNLVWVSVRIVMVPPLQFVVRFMGPGRDSLVILAVSCGEAKGLFGFGIRLVVSVCSD